MQKKSVHIIFQTSVSDILVTLHSTTDYKYHL